MTELALIPPLVLQEHYTRRHGFHLFLPQLMHYEVYKRYVKDAIGPRSYTILDNGAFEGEVDITSMALMKMAIELGVDEVVVPDTLGDMAATIAKADEFNDFLKHNATSEHYGKNYMGVVQGKTIEECWQCIEHFVDLGYVTTIGLPKHLVKTVQLDTRIVLAKEILEELGDGFDIHFLGSSPLWLSEISHVHKTVRSMDTSMPFVQAYYEKEINGNEGKERPDNYFKAGLHNFRHDLVKHNVEIMTKWANGS